MTIVIAILKKVGLIGLALAGQVTLAAATETEITQIGEDLTGGNAVTIPIK